MTKGCLSGVVDRAVRKIFRAIVTIALFSLITFLLLPHSPVAAVIHGDINTDGSVDVQDVALVMRHSLGLLSFDDAQSFVADVNGDRRIDVRDVSQIMRKALGLIDSFSNAPLSESHLISDFMVGPGLAPGKKLVFVTLNVAEQEEYRVFAGASLLIYSETNEGFLGEVAEADAVQDKVSVYKK
jgi:hypothetical protein